MRGLEIVYALEAEGAEMDRGSFNGHIMGRQVRVNCNHTVDIGDDNFDRWANSVAANFNPSKKKFARQLKRALIDSGVDVSAHDVPGAC